MSYRISKQIRIVHEQDDWDYVLSTDEYGTVSVLCTEGCFEANEVNTTEIHIPKDCVQHFIDALEQLK